MKQPTSDELDTIWRKEAANGNDTALCLEQNLQRFAEMYEDTLSELRDLARLKFHESPDLAVKIREIDFSGE